VSEIAITWLVWTDQAGVVYERRIMDDKDLPAQLARGPIRTEHGYCIPTVVVARVPLVPSVQTIKGVVDEKSTG
jgi:hypothetical protein